MYVYIYIYRYISEHLPPISPAAGDARLETPGHIGGQVVGLL